ncbi:restriction endonuclease subunit S [Vibrio splendidus]|uniref:restriction endonuclease subunit S n=1 Tax=Vibrio splendidus TaxID=29497 RepID=UPI000E32AF0F|nr:restriction endonuclease subunit S [Vibrio splendidus]
MNFDLPEGWVLKTLSSCCTETISYGIVQPGTHDDDGVPVVRVNNFTKNGLELSDVLRVSQSVNDKYKRTVLKGGEVLLTLVGSTGQSVIVPDSMAGWNVPRAIAVLRVSDEVGAEWVNCCLQSPIVKHFLDARANTTVQKTLNLKDVKDIPIPVPPTEYKEKALGALVSLAQKLDNNRQTNQTLEHMAQTIFKSWFVDFEPVKAKMSGEQPEGMDAATASLFPEKLVESELGLIPEGWEVTKLSKVIDLLNGFAFKSPDYVKEGTFVLRTKNFDSSNSVERLGDDVYLPDEFLESHKKYLCEAYDYHVVMVAASIGKTAMIYPHQLPALRNQNMWCFRPKDESLRFYTKYMVDGLVKLNMGLASGSARAFFKKGDFNSYEFALPTSELLVKFNDVVGNLVKQKGSLLNQNVQLAAMRDTLLPKLLSGEIELEVR